MPHAERLNAPTSQPCDLAALVTGLEAQHGRYAAAIADFYATLHDSQGDVGRSWAWSDVAALVRQRERQRLS